LLGLEYACPSKPPATSAVKSSICWPNTPLKSVIETSVNMTSVNVERISEVRKALASG
jgi:hypothetical protein